MYRNVYLKRGKDESLKRFHPWVFSGAIQRMDEGIEEGDILVIDKSLELQDDDLAVCFIDGDFTVKRVRIEPNAVWLIPANPKYSLIKVTKENEFIVWGIVTYTNKKNRRKR